MPNKSLDVRAKQRLSFGVAWLLLAGLVAVSPHVNSIVMFFVFAEIEIRMSELLKNFSSLFDFQVS